MSAGFGQIGENDIIFNGSSITTFVTVGTLLKYLIPSLMRK
jgi:hypothetical protein